MKSKVLKRRYIRRARSLMAVLIVMLMTAASFPFMTAMDMADEDDCGTVAAGADISEETVADETGDGYADSEEAIPEDADFDETIPEDADFDENVPEDADDTDSGIAEKRPEDKPAEKSGSIRADDTGDADLPCETDDAINDEEDSIIDEDEETVIGGGIQFVIVEDSDGDFNKRVLRCYCNDDDCICEDCLDCLVANRIVIIKERADTEELAETDVFALLADSVSENPYEEAEIFDLGPINKVNSEGTQEGWVIADDVLEAFLGAELFVFHLDIAGMTELNAGGIGGIFMIFNPDAGGWDENKITPDWTNTSGIADLPDVVITEDEYIFTVDLINAKGYETFAEEGGNLYLAYYGGAAFFDAITSAYFVFPEKEPCAEHTWSTEGADDDKHICIVCDRQELCTDFVPGEIAGEHNCGICGKLYECTWRGDGTCADCGQKNPDYVEYESTIIDLGPLNAVNNENQQGWELSAEMIENLSKAAYFVFTLPAEVLEAWGAIGGTQFIFNSNSGGWDQTDVTPGWTTVENFDKIASNITTVTLGEDGRYHFSVDLVLTTGYPDFLEQEGKILLGNYGNGENGPVEQFFANVAAYLVVYEGEAPPPPCRHSWNHDHVCTQCGETHPSGKAHSFNSVDVCTICGYVNPETENPCALYGHDYAPAGSDNGRWGHNCARNCGGLDWEDHSFVNGTCSKCGYAGLAPCYRGQHLYQATGGDNGRWGHNCARNCGMMDWENHNFNENGVCAQCNYKLPADAMQEIQAAEDGETETPVGDAEEDEIIEEDNRDVGGITVEGVQVDENVIKQLLESSIAEGKTPVININDLIAETGGSILTAEMFLLIKELGIDVIVQLPGGFSYTIIASSINDSVGAFDLNISIYMTSSDLTIDDQVFPLGSIVINPNFKGFFGFDIKIHITAAQLAEAGIAADSINLFHIDGDNKVTFIGTLGVNSDGSVDFSINSASYYTITGSGVTAPVNTQVTAETSGDGGSNTVLIVILCVAGVLLAGGVIILVMKRKKAGA